MKMKEARDMKLQSRKQPDGCDVT